jgi:hypothetical protein
MLVMYFGPRFGDERDGSDIAYGLDSVIESGDTTVRICLGFFLGVRF